MEGLRRRSLDRDYPISSRLLAPALLKMQAARVEVCASESSQSLASTTSKASASTLCGPARSAMCRQRSEAGSSCRDMPIRKCAEHPRTTRSPSVSRGVSRLSDGASNHINIHILSATAAYSSGVSMSVKAPSSNTSTSPTAEACARTIGLTPLAGSAPRNCPNKRRSMRTG